MFSLYLRNNNTFTEYIIFVVQILIYSKSSIDRYVISLKQYQYDVSVVEVVVQLRVLTIH
jgi:hypothetical protein